MTRINACAQVICAPRVTLVSNSIGTISALQAPSYIQNASTSSFPRCDTYRISPYQAAIDKPELFNGVFVCAPNFRELHVAEQPPLLAPLTSTVQARVDQ